MWSEEEQMGIISAYFHGENVRCPEDESFLDIQSSTSMGGIDVYVFCPYCKNEFDWKNTTRGAVWPKDQIIEFIKNELRGIANECPNCGSLIEVEREEGEGENRTRPYIVKCARCLLYDDMYF